MLYHMGCGHQRLDGYINVDINPTEATDVTADLNEPELEDADGVFSHAFFEHLRRDKRVTHLQAVRGALKPGGFVCYIGLPDFRRVAELYLAGGPGVVGPTFDLYNVYRYTHGDPEPAVDWTAQLHKSLFDIQELATLLRDSGYASYAVFRYVFPQDPPGLDVSIGFYATRDRVGLDDLQANVRQFLQQFDGRFLRLDTLQFEDGSSRPAALASLTSMPRRNLARRFAHAAAVRLARI